MSSPPPGSLDPGPERWKRCFLQIWTPASVSKNYCWWVQNSVDVTFCRGHLLGRSAVRAPLSLGSREPSNRLGPPRNPGTCRSTLRIAATWVRGARSRVEQGSDFLNTPTVFLLWSNRSDFLIWYCLHPWIDTIQGPSSKKGLHELDLILT